MADFRCPCCGAPMGRAAPIDDVIGAVQSSVQRTVLVMLSRPVGRWVTLQAIVDRVYQGVSGGGPLNPTNIVSQARLHLQRKIVSFGWRIDVTGNSRGIVSYRLMPIRGEATP